MKNYIIEYFPSLHSRAISKKIDSELKAFLVFKSISKYHTNNQKFIDKELLINDFLYIYRKSAKVIYSNQTVELLIDKLKSLDFLIEKNNKILFISTKKLIQKLGIKLDKNNAEFILCNVKKIDIFDFITKESLKETLFLEDLRYYISKKERSNTFNINKYNKLYNQNINIQDYQRNSSIRLSQDVLSRYVFGNMNRKYVVKYLSIFVTKGYIKEYKKNKTIQFEADNYMVLKFFTKYEKHEKFGEKEKIIQEIEYNYNGKKIVETEMVEEPTEINTNDLESNYPTFKSNKKTYKYQANTIVHNFSEKTKALEIFVINKDWLYSNYGENIYFAFKLYSKKILSLLNNIDNIFKFLSSLKFLKIKNVT